MSPEPEDAPARTVAGESRLQSRALAVLMTCGGLVVVLATMLSPPTGATQAGLYAVGAVALALGGVTFVWPSHRVWTPHVLFAGGTGLICLGAYFAGAASGLYSAMLVWLVVVAASFFSPRAVTAHVAWILLASGATLATVGELPGSSAAMRWGVGGALLVIAATVMGRIAADRRSTEERLRAEIAERERLQRELEHLAAHDPLTGVANRRRLAQELDRQIARARRERTPLSVVTLDVDELKEHNDVHGHAAGDRLLKHVASTWAAAVRPGDLIARTGGDEFVALLPDCSHAAAERLAARLRGEVAAACGCSAGTACWDGRESADELLARADSTMYDAKRAGASNRSASAVRARSA